MKKIRFINRLMGSPHYWTISYLYERHVVFNFYKGIYFGKYNLREERISFNLLKHTLKSILIGCVYAAFFVLIFESLAYILNLGNFKSASAQISDYLSALVTVTGVFLGLYFTALSAVAGNLFMKAPQNLQELFIRDREGNQYIRTLALTTIIGFYYMLLNTFYGVSYIGMISVTILAGYAVMRFLSLGFQTFYFLHPLQAGNTVTQDILHTIDNVKAIRNGWNKNFLQKHNHIKAKHSIDTLKNLIEFGTAATHFSNQHLLEIAKFITGTMYYFINNKKQIPAESLWFAEKNEFKSWFLTDAIEVSMALQSGTTINPRTVKEYDWLENECLNILLNIFDYYVKNKKWDYALSAIELIVHIIEKAAEELYLDLAKSITEKTQTAILKVLSKTDETVNHDDTLGHIALIDSLGRLPISSLLGVMKYVRDNDISILQKEIDQIKWIKNDSIYKAKLPGTLITILEETQKKLKNEVAIEGKIISPKWYIQMIIIRRYLMQIKNYFDYLKLINDSYEKQIDQCISEKRYMQAAQLTEKWIEYNNKLQNFDGLLNEYMNKGKSLHMVKDLSWTEYDKQKEHDQVTNYSKKATDKFVQILPHIEKIPDSEAKDIPDYFGHAFTYGVEACYQAAYDNDASRLGKLFPEILLGSLKAYEKTQKSVVGWAEASKIIFPSEPIEDLLTLSGYIIIYSELYENKELFQICVKTWNAYLNTDNAKEKISYFLALTEYRDSQLTIMPKETLRQNWVFHMQRKFRELHIFNPADPFGYEDDTKESKDFHQSPIIRVLSRNQDFILHEARDVFFIMYLKEHAAAKDIKFSDRKGLNELLEREKKKKSKKE